MPACSSMALEVAEPSARAVDVLRLEETGSRPTSRNAGLRPSGAVSLAWALNGKPPQRCSSAASRARDRSALIAKRAAKQLATGAWAVGNAGEGGLSFRCPSTPSSRRPKSGPRGGAPAPADGLRRSATPGAKPVRRPSLTEARPGSTGGRLQQDGGRARERGGAAHGASAWAPPGSAEGRPRAWVEKSVEFAAASTSTAISSICQDGLWWEWQTRGASGWSNLDPAISDKLEEAYTLGQPACRFWRDGELVEFDLRGALEALGDSRLRRVRMPQTEDENAFSMCSTTWVPAASRDIEALESSTVNASRWADADDPQFYMSDLSHEFPASPGKDTMASMMESTRLSQWLSP